MSKRRLSFEESYRRAVAATKSGSADEPIDVSSRVKRAKSADTEPARRFIGDCQIDLKWKRLATDAGGAVRPWYIATLTIGRMTHKFSLGAAADWGKRWSGYMDPGLVDELVQTAVRFALDEEDDGIPDHVTDAVKRATAKALRKDGSYEVRAAI